MAARHIDLEVTWGDVRLAVVRVSLPVRIDSVLRAAGVYLSEELRMKSGPRETLELREARGSVLAAFHGHRVTRWTIHGLDLRAWPADEVLALPPRRPDVAWLSALAFAGLFVVGAGWLLRASGMRGSGPVERNAALAALGRRAARFTSTVRAHAYEPPAGAASSATHPIDVDPSEVLPDDRAARLVAASLRHVPGSVAALAVVAQRGSLGLGLASARTVQTLGRVGRTFAEMAGAVAPDRDPTDARFRYGNLTLSSTGAGGGCSPGADCERIAVDVTLGDRWRPRATAMAHAAMQARAAAEIEVRAPALELGELTPAYVQQRVRRDVLAGVVRCHSEALEQDPGVLPGRVVTRFEISTEGRVTSAVIASSAIARPAVEGCILRVLRAMTFPPNAVGAHVTYPFVFSSFMPER